ncbi:MAG: magnesium-translocating P-type ATPase [Streptosporangiaceae bacterium]
MAWAPDQLADRAAGNDLTAGQTPAASPLAGYADAAPLLVLRALGATPRGLTEDEAESRRARHGDNALAAGRRRWAARLLGAASSRFIIMLACLAVVSAATGDPAGAVVLGVIVVTASVLRARQEHRSDRTAVALRDLAAATATVLRRPAPELGPACREIPVDQLVVGDIVRLAAGDLVPADLRLLSSAGLTASQAALTGESRPVLKRAALAAGPLAGGGPDGSGGPDGNEAPAAGQAGRPDGAGSLFDSEHLCFMGSRVVSGTGTAVVVATGAATYLGMACGAQPAARPARARTSFDRSSANVAWLLSSLMLSCVALVLAVSAVNRGELPETLLFAIAVAVGIVPEMLPLVVTSALARGSAVLGGQTAIVRKLSAVHDLGAMDVLCTDKTGTLTRDQPWLECAVGPDGRPDPAVLRWAWLNAHWSAEAAMLADPATGAVIDMLDQALLDCGTDRGLAAGPGCDLAGFLPSGSGRRLATVIIRSCADPGRHTLITKGAPEDVLRRCTHLRSRGRDVPLTAAGRARALRLAGARGRDGVRFLAVAAGPGRPARRRYGPADEDGLTLVGFVGFGDPPAATARRAIAGLTARGVTVKIMTGDHPQVAARLCADVGLAAGQVVTGEQIAGLDDAALAAAADSAAVFARVDPGQKARLVRALQAAGHTVGFLGDGVNDTAALRAADVGLAVAGAVPVVCECAQVILLHEDLTTLERAIGTGRRSVASIGKYLKITISSNFGNALSMIVASAALPFLPMLPLQVLAQNICFDAAQFALAFDHADDEALRRPHTFGQAALTRFVLFFGPVSTLADLAIFVLLWHIIGGHASAAGQAVFRAGWFAENLLTQAVAVHLLRSRRLPSRRWHAAWPVLLATAGLAVAAVGIPVTPLGAALGLQAPPAVFYPLLAAVLAGYAVLVIAARAAWAQLTARRRTRRS